MDKDIQAGFCHFLLLFLVTLLLQPATLDARPASVKPGGAGVSLLSMDQELHDVNDVRLVVSNQGPIGLDLQSGNGSGFFPASTSNNYVFGTGLWLGTRYDADGDGNLDKVFTEGYNPLAGDSEFREGANDQDRDDPLTRVFDSTDPDDRSEWPERYREIDPRTGDLVPLIRSDQDLVTTYTTQGKQYLTGPFQMPVEVSQRSMAFKGGLAGQTIIFEWEMNNWGEDVMLDSWVGYDSDMDIGVSFQDDLTSFVRDRITPEGDTVHVNMAYAWDSDFQEHNFIGDPGFVGIAYLRGPGNPTDGIDNDGDGLIDESPYNGIDDDGDGLTDEDDEVDQLGLVNFTKHCNPSYPCEVMDPGNDVDGYDILNCVGEDNPNSTSWVSCSESTNPADIRFMVSSGPFDWQPGEREQIVMAMVFANAVGDPGELDFYGSPPRPDPNDPILSELLAVKETVQHLFDLDFKAAEPPVPPELTLVPGDGQVTLLWDDRSLTTPDPDYAEFVKIDPEYREYDFEGFRVWRSRTGAFSELGDPDDPDYPLTPESIQQNSDVAGLDLTLLAQYDLADGVTTDSLGVACIDSVVLESGIVEYTDCDTFNLGADTGVRYSYVDRGDSVAAIRNGFRYYYALTAYDYNSDDLPVSRRSLDSGVLLSMDDSVIPRSNASSFVGAFGKLEHVDELGAGLDDTSSIFSDTTTGDLWPVDSVRASNALTGFEFSPGIPELVSDDYYTLVLDSFEMVDRITSRIGYHIEDAAGERLYSGPDPTFQLRYDGVDHLMGASVFDPADSASVIFTSELTFNVDTSAFVVPDPSIHFLAENASGSDILDTLWMVTVGDYTPGAFRASDLRMEWVEAGADSLTLEVTDQDNGVDIPFGEGVVDSTGGVSDREKGSNWSFLPVAGGAIQPGGRYFLTTAPLSIADIWLSGVRLTASFMTEMPAAGDVWTLRQLAYDLEISVDTTVVVEPDSILVDTTFAYHDARRPPVPGTRYRIDTQSGGQDKGSVNLSKIRVVPNPYLASAGFDEGPSQRRQEFINLPPECTIRIYTISGVLVRVLQHTSGEGGTEAYDLKSSEGLPLASGNYYYHVTTPDGETRLGRFALIQ